MVYVLHVTTVDRNFLIRFSDGSSSLLSPEELAAKLKAGKTHSLDVELEASQVEAVAALAMSTGQTVDDFIETAIIEKLLREG